jgi:hypothetical protein
MAVNGNIAGENMTSRENDLVIHVRGRTTPEAESLTKNKE